VNSVIAMRPTPRRLVHAVGIRDLPGREAERRRDAPDAPDPGQEAEPLEIRERSHHRLLAAHSEVGQPLEREEHAAVFLGQVQQRLEHALGRPRDDAAMPAALLGNPRPPAESAEFPRQGAKRACR
jgi:hypothetical protein